MGIFFVKSFFSVNSLEFQRATTDIAISIDNSLVGESRINIYKANLTPFALRDSFHAN